VDIDILGSLTEVPKRLGPVYVAPEELAHVNRAPRQPFLDRDDLTVLNIVVASLVGSACGLATGFGCFNRVAPKPQPPSPESWSGFSVPRLRS
jgi:hypothetical protein